MKGTRRSLYWKALILLATLSLLSAHPIRAADSLDGIRAGLARWDAEQAWELAKSLLEREPRNPKLLEITAYVAFFRGDYAQALSKIREAMAEGAPEEDLRDFQLFVQRTYDIIRHHAVYSSDHFELKLDEKMDGILVRYLLDALEKTYHQMGSQYGFFPQEPIRVEVLADSESFYYVSGLSKRDIEVSGAVGLAKYNKIMLLSPRALVYGYRYLDAASHEYLHYLIFKISANKAPIWVHEGLAKFEEAKWRSATSLYLGPLNQTILARAVRSGEFVGFDQMEPSLVRLETPEQVQLAYAEAASAIDFIIDRVGYSGLKAIMASMANAEQPGAWAAIQKVMGLTMAEFEDGWKGFLAMKGLSEQEGIEVRPYKVRESQRDEHTLDLKEIKSIMARNWVTLGDMLRARGRLNAAVIEYRKALDETPASVVILKKLSVALLHLGKYDQAVEGLSKAEKIAPDHPAVHSNLGYAYLRLKRYQEAKSALNHSVSINPFDARVHQGLVQVHHALGETKEAKAEEEIFRKLQWR
jgi:Flp pilus assembly protein TadD